MYQDKKKTECNPREIYEFTLLLLLLLLYFACARTHYTLFSLKILIYTFASSAPSVPLPPATTTFDRDEYAYIIMSRDVIAFMCCLLNKSFGTVPSKEITRFACGDYTLRKIVVFSRNQYREISTGKSMND